MSFKAYLASKARGMLGIPELEKNVQTLLGKDLLRASEVQATYASAEFINHHMPDATALDSNHSVLDYALSRVPSQPNGLYCEFGVFRGHTLNYIAKKINTTIYGFDSFKGLPERWREGFPKGEFAIPDEETIACESNVELVRGWFHESLPPFLASHLELVVFLHIDCDLYSSTKTVLDHLAGRIAEGAVIVFDEYFSYPGWQAHEHRALQEFLKTTGRRVEYLCYNRYHEQVAVRIL